MYVYVRGREGVKPWSSNISILELHGQAPYEIHLFTNLEYVQAEGVQKLGNLCVHTLWMVPFLVCICVFYKMLINNVTRRAKLRENYRATIEYHPHMSWRVGADVNNTVDFFDVSRIVIEASSRIPIPPYFTIPHPAINFRLIPYPAANYKAWRWGAGCVMDTP